MPIAPGEADFYEGEGAGREIFEKPADIQQQSFVREEFSVCKQVERDTVEVEEKINWAELDLDTQCLNLIEKTKTL